MGSDLKDTVGAGVNDRLPGLHMLLTQLLQDYCTGSWVIAQCRAPDPPLKLGDDVSWKAIRISGKGCGERYSHQFPVATGGVLSG